MKEDGIFINEGLDYAITMYLRSKDRPYSFLYNSFLVVVIRALVSIYGEKEIVEPFLTSANEEVFDNNLKLYGYKNESKFKELIQKYYAWSKEQSKEENKKLFDNKSDEFVLIQKELIDMMLSKMRNIKVSLEEESVFESLLYTPNNPNSNYVLFNMRFAKKPEEIEHLWKVGNFRVKNQLTFTEIKKNVLSPKIYETMNIKLEDVLEMKQKEIDNLNTGIYKKFKIDANEQNALEKLNSAVDKFFNKKPVTSGNGFVDGLVLFSIVSTLAMVSFIISAIVMG